MLLTISVVFLIMWVFGIMGSYAMGGYIHILLVISVITILFNIIQDRKIL